MILKVNKSQNLNGEISMPRSKTHSFRALILASLANGTSIIKEPNDIIDVGNSGTMLFFISGVAAACPGWSVITGDESIRNLRKISRNLFQPFYELGVKIISTKNDGMSPLVIKGRVNGGKAYMDGTGCQPVFSV